MGTSMRTRARSGACGRANWPSSDWAIAGASRWRLAKIALSRKAAAPERGPEFAQQFGNDRERREVRWRRDVEPGGRRSVRPETRSGRVAAIADAMPAPMETPTMGSGPAVMVPADWIPGNEAEGKQ